MLNLVYSSAAIARLFLVFLFWYASAGYNFWVVVHLLSHLGQFFNIRQGCEYNCTSDRISVYECANLKQTVYPVCLWAQNICRCVNCFWKQRKGKKAPPCGKKYLLLFCACWCVPTRTNCTFNTLYSMMPQCMWLYYYWGSVSVLIHK